MNQDPPQEHQTTDLSSEQRPGEQDLHDDLDILHLATPSSRVNGRPGKRTPPLGAKRLGRWKAKGKPRVHESDGGECYLLGLPEDVLHVLLTRLPPRSLLALAVTCRRLHEELEDEAVWRGSYVNRYLWDGAARDVGAKEEVKVLVQGCMGISGKGWKEEALRRQMMLDRWVASKTSMVVHHPPVGLIHSLSLSYPPFVHSPPKPLVVGKTHHTPTKAGPSSPRPLDATQGADDDALATTPSKITHRQKYEALLAATTRSPPYILSAGLTVGGVVRSDPMSGKVSKGFWGPGRDANFHLRPHLDHQSPPSAIFLPARDQTFVLWGLLTGSCVHTTILSRHHATHGGRASSLNVLCDSSDAHEGEVTDVWAPELSEALVRWVTAGADGRVKYWQLRPGQNSNSGKRSATDAIPGSITCLFTSSPTDAPFFNRSDAVKRRQTGAPDAVILARCDVGANVVCGVTEDGDLQVWFDADDADRRDVRLDVGSKDEFGGVERLELDVQKESEGPNVSILVHHSCAPTYTRYDLTHPVVGEPVPTTRTFTTISCGAITSLQAYLLDTPPISVSPNPLPALSARISISGEHPAFLPPPPLDLSISPRVHNHFGRFVVGGDQDGSVYVWAWDGKDEVIKPIRSWSAMSGKITAIDVSCGLVAVGSFDGYLKIFDPLPTPQILLRTFHASHLSLADALVAASTDFDALYYTVNQIVLENDLIVATIGRKVFAWRAGTGKGRQDGKGGDKRRISGGRDLKGTGRILDMKTLHQDAADSHKEMKERNEATRVPSRHEQQHLVVMEDLGLDDAEDAVQYAMMLSLDDKQDGTSSKDDGGRASQVDEEELAALAAVRAFESAEEREEREVREAIEMVRQAENRFRGRR